MTDEYVFEHRFILSSKAGQNTYHHPEQMRKTIDAKITQSFPTYSSTYAHTVSVENVLGGSIGDGEQVKIRVAPEWERDPADPGKNKVKATHCSVEYRSKTNTGTRGIVVLERLEAIVEEVYFTHG